MSFLHIHNYGADFFDVLSSGIPCWNISESSDTQWIPKFKKQKGKHSILNIGSVDIRQLGLYSDECGCWIVVEYKYVWHLATLLLSPFNTPNFCDNSEDMLRMYLSQDLSNRPKITFQYILNHSDTDFFFFFFHTLELMTCTK